MDVKPIVTIATTIYFPDGKDGNERFRTALQAVASWTNYLKYDGEMKFHIADDGSDQYESRVYSLLRICPDESTVSRQYRKGVGASLNAGFRRLFEYSDIAAYIVDDWELQNELDLNPWVQLLMEDESVGMVRLGLAHPDISGSVRHIPSTGEYYLRLDRHHFAFGHRPALFHKRMFEAYGWFQEGVNAFECEREYAQRYASMAGPAVGLALLHPWRHISNIELAGITPG